MTIILQTSRNRPGLPSELLTGELVVARSVDEQDLPALKTWDDDEEIAALMGRKFVHTTAEAWYRQVSEGRDCKAMVLETRDSGLLIGEWELAQIDRRMGTAEIRICIGNKAYWGRGYGRDAMQVALRVAFNGCNLKTVYLRVFESNLRAVRLYDRLGFQRKGLLQPSERRGDPAAVLLMSISRERWQRFQMAPAPGGANLVS